MREFTGTWMRHSGDFWGGFAAMLVALPASVAFGVTVYSAVSPHHAAFGALAGILGATALGLIAPTFGGTDRLISSPCAPAAAVLTAFAMQLVTQGVEPFAIVLLLAVLGLLKTDQLSLAVLDGEYAEVTTTAAVTAAIRAERGRKERKAASGK